MISIIKLLRAFIIPLIIHLVTKLPELIAERKTQPKLPVEPEPLFVIQQEYDNGPEAFITKHFGSCNAKTEGYVMALVEKTKGKVLLSLTKPRTREYKKVKEHLKASKQPEKINYKV